jgi:hypothetical protein
MSPPATMQALCRANLGILRQKLHLMDVMRTRFGQEQATSLYAQVCPVVQASIGQHVRHSMDHLELAVRIANTTGENELHYDLRKRGGDDENDLVGAEKRILGVVNVLQNLEDQEVVSRPIQAYFMLSGDPQEFQLPTTIEREMGFAVHHAIHHMAMVKIIATQTVGLSKEELSPDFGRAPSTIVYDKTLSNDANPQ